MGVEGKDRAKVLEAGAASLSNQLGQAVLKLRLATTESYLDKNNTPNVWYSIAVTSNTDEDDLTSPLSTWMDCLHDFDSFVDNPEDFLKNHT